MGTLLLQGWAMLDKTCPDCDVPIMRSRQNEEICCVCETEYKNKTEEKKEPQNAEKSAKDVVKS